MIVQVVLTALVIASWAWWVFAASVSWFFFHRARQRGANSSRHTPPVSVLKPVRGIDPSAYQNFVSFCVQDYPQYEIVFGVADPADPVVGLILRLMSEHANVPIRLVECPPTGANRKASILHQLVGSAEHDVLVASDSDMRVGTHYLERVVGPLADDAIGLVTCPYIARDCEGFTARLAALHMGVTFLPSVLVARLVIKGFAMGSTIALRKQSLDLIGGFAAIQNHLADDYEIGARLAHAGKRIVMSDYLVTNVLGRPRLREQWHREVRWTRCSRVSRPVEYPGLLLSLSTPLALLTLAAYGFGAAGWYLLAGSLVVRWVVAWWISGLVGDTVSRSSLALLPARDVMSALVWSAGFVGRSIRWRGERFVLQRDGTISPAYDMHGPARKSRTPHVSPQSAPPETACGTPPSR